MKTVTSPFVAIHCPYTHETVLVKEAVVDDKGEFQKWGWVYKGKSFDNLDDVLEFRSKKYV